jgi:hypothetical protein
MLPRSLVILLCPLLAAGGVWLGYLCFEQTVQFISTGSVSLLVKFHSEAQQLARSSFAIACGLLGFSIPFAALAAGRFRARARYLEPLFMGLLIGSITTTIALFYYRYEMQSLGIKLGEFITLMRNSKREIAMNPLTRSMLFGTSMTLLAGLVRSLFSPLSGKR